VTPSILRVVTRSISIVGGGGMTGRFFLLSLKTISRDVFLLSTKLFARTHVSMPSILHAGTIYILYMCRLQICTFRFLESSRSNLLLSPRRLRGWCDGRALYDTSIDHLHLSCATCLVNKLTSQLQIWSGMSSRASFFSNVKWQTESKALLESMEITTTYGFSSSIG